MSPKISLAVNDVDSMPKGVCAVRRNQISDVPAGIVLNGGTLSDRIRDLAEPIAAVVLKRGGQAVGVLHLRDQSVVCWSGLSVRVSQSRGS